MRKRRMSAKQRKYFSKRKRTPRRSVKPRGVNVARRRSFKRYASRGVGGMKTMIAPVLGGVADSIIDPISPVDGVGGTVVGMFMHNETVKNIGLYKVGYSLGNILPIPKLGSGGSTAGGLL